MRLRTAQNLFQPKNARIEARNRVKHDMLSEESSKKRCPPLVLSINIEGRNEHSA